MSTYTKRDRLSSDAHQRIRILALITLLTTILYGCRESAGDKPISSNSAVIVEERFPESEAIQLFDVTSKSGIDFLHDDGSFGKFCLPETMSGGLALFDYDSDGLVDVYLCNGTPLEPSTTAPSRGHSLYKNLGNMRFVNATSTAGVACHRFGLGATVGDIDNDGFLDLYLSNFGENTLYRNNGDGSFLEVTQQAGVGLGERFSAGATFLDVNSDGNLELFVANYVQFSPSDIASQSQLRRTMYPGPQDFVPETCALLQNCGDGSWINTSQTSRITEVRGTGMGCICGDFDTDGDLDIYVANDEMPNFLFRNDGSGVFDEAAVTLGLAVDGNGQASGSMGIDAGDLDNDGRFDLFVTTFENETVKLFRMTEHQVYMDVSRQSHVGDGTLPHVTWGCCVGDLENDGDRDIFVASGHLDHREPDAFYYSRNLVLKNILKEQRKFQFADIAERCGDMADVRHCSRGAAVADLDNDGDLDAVVMNLRDKVTVIENRSSRAENGWLELDMIGVICNRDAIGTKVRVYTGNDVYCEEVRNGRGYQSYWGDRLHFGLGNAVIDRIEIDWFNGQQQVIRSVETNHQLTVVQPTP